MTRIPIPFSHAIAVAFYVGFDGTIEMTIRPAGLIYDHGLQRAASISFRLIFENCLFELHAVSLQLLFPYTSITASLAQSLHNALWYMDRDASLCSQTVRSCVPDVKAVKLKIQI